MVVTDAVGDIDACELGKEEKHTFIIRWDRETWNYFKYLVVFWIQIVNANSNYGKETILKQNLHPLFPIDFTTVSFLFHRPEQIQSNRDWGNDVVFGSSLP